MFSFGIVTGFCITVVLEIIAIAVAAVYIDKNKKK